MTRAHTGDEVEERWMKRLVQLDVPGETAPTPRN